MVKLRGKVFANGADAIECVLHTYSIPLTRARILNTRLLKETGF